MIKPKSVIVIVLSSILISAVILLTIFGLSFYIGWKERESGRVHKDRMSEINAKMYAQYINLTGLEANYGNKNFGKDKHLLEGTVENTGYRTLTSLKIKVSFLNASGEVIHTEILHPLKTPAPSAVSTIADLALFTSGKETPMMPRSAVKFVHIMEEQREKNIVSPIKDKKYATNPNEWSGKFRNDITNIRF